MGWGIIGKLTAILVGLVVMAGVSGYVGSVLWGWFVVPVLAVRPITILEAIGLGMLIAYWGGRSEHGQEVERGSLRRVGSVHPLYVGPRMVSA